MEPSLWSIIFGLFILLGLEIRNRYAFEQIGELKKSVDRLIDEVIKIKDELKKKKNIVEDYKE